MHLITTLLLLALTALTACDRPKPLQLQLGAQVISIAPPVDWEHFDYGDRQHFRKDFERIVLELLRHSGQDLEKAAKRSMVQLGENTRREIATREGLQIDGRDALAIDTWDHLSHQYRKSYVFIGNAGEILVIYMMQGRFENMQPAFADLLASFTFVDSLPEAEAPFSRRQQ